MSQGRTIYVGNVNASLDEATIKALFQHCGNITEVRIAGEPTYNTRYCFVEFTTPMEAATALSLNGLQLADREIRVSMAKQSLTNSASAVMPSMLGYPNLVNPYAAMMPSFGMPMARQRPAQDAEKVSRTIHIDNLDFGISEYHLAQYFGVCGNVSAVRIAGNPGARRKAWVEFHDPMSVQSAFQLDNQVLGSMPIRVTQSKSAIHTNGLTITPAMQQQMAMEAQAKAAAAAAAAPPPAHFSYHQQSQATGQALPPPPPVPHQAQQHPQRGDSPPRRHRSRSRSGSPDYDRHRRSRSRSPGRSRSPPGPPGLGSDVPGLYSDVRQDGDFGGEDDDDKHSQDRAENQE